MCASIRPTQVVALIKAHQYSSEVNTASADVVICKHTLVVPLKPHQKHIYFLRYYLCTLGKWQQKCIKIRFALFAMYDLVKFIRSI